MNLERHSERLKLRPFSPDELELCIEMFTDPDIEIGYFVKRSARGNG